MANPMNRCLRGALLGAVVFGSLAFSAGDAVAQAKGGAGGASSKAAVATKGDKSIAGKKGMDSLGTKEIDSNKLPGKFEMGLAAGSVVAMIAAFKYL